MNVAGHRIVLQTPTDPTYSGIGVGLLVVCIGTEFLVADAYRETEVHVKRVAVLECQERLYEAPGATEHDGLAVSSVDTIDIDVVIAICKVYSSIEYPLGMAWHLDAA